jgi:hypothetical protein
MIGENLVVADAALVVVFTKVSSVRTGNKIRPSTNHQNVPLLNVEKKVKLGKKRKKQATKILWGSN